MCGFSLHVRLCTAHTADAHGAEGAIRQHHTAAASTIWVLGLEPGTSRRPASALSP